MPIRPKTLMLLSCILPLPFSVACSGDPTSTPGPSPTQTAAPASSTPSPTGAPTTATQHPPTPSPTGASTTATQHPPTPSPSATATAAPATPTEPSGVAGVPQCRLTTGDDGGFRFSLDGGVTLAPNRSNLDSIAYTWALDIDPRDPNVIWQLHEGILYKSEDAGCTFSRASLNLIDAQNIWRAPSNPDLMVLTSFYNPTLHISENGGRTWQTETAPTDVYDLAISPDDPWAWTLLGRASELYYRPDRETKWDARPIPVDEITNIHDGAFDANDPRLWYIATSKGLFRTEDAGSSWENLTTAFPTTIGDPAEDVITFNALTVAVAPSDPNVVYVNFLLAGLSNSERALWRSEDGGASFEKKVVNLQPIDDYVVHINAGAKAYIHPDDPDEVRFVWGTYVDGYGVDLFRSSDGLTTLDYTNFSGFHDSFDMAWGPSGTQVLFVAASSEIPN